MGFRVMRTNPHILEINTRMWLARLGKKYGRQMTFAGVPDEEWRALKELGFDAVWFMGVWTTSPGAQNIAQNTESISNAVKKVYPDYSKEDIAASPFAVYDYNVSPSLGGNAELKQVREKLNSMGIAVFLDFVGNHFSFDHPLVTEHPEYFINAGKTPPSEGNKNLFFKAPNGYYIAHGRDPYFPPWTDTAQINYFNLDMQEEMTRQLLHVASMCDGVRCDMAMLSLNKIIRDIWQFAVGNDAPKQEFWTRAIGAVREKTPEFIFIAEVYWGLEWEIQEIGFDYTYDKILYDRLRFSTAGNISGHLNAEHLYQRRSIRFIANHDEEVALKAFGRDKSFAAAAIISTLSGARMFHLFQLYGKKDWVPIQYMADFFEEDKTVYAFYKRLLKEVNAPAYHGGQWSLLPVDMVSDSRTYENILSWVWSQAGVKKLVLINYSSEKAMCKVDVSKFKASKIEEDVFYEKGTPPCNEALSTGCIFEPYEVKIFTLHM